MSDGVVGTRARGLIVLACRLSSSSVGPAPFIVGDGDSPCACVRWAVVISGVIVLSSLDRPANLRIWSWRSAINPTFVAL